MLSRGDNLGVGGEQDVEAKALRSVRWYARRWREKLSQTWLQSCRKCPPPPQAAGHPTLRDGSTSNGTSADRPAVDAVMEEQLVKLPETQVQRIRRRWE